METAGFAADLAAGAAEAEDAMPRAFIYSSKLRGTEPDLSEDGAAAGAGAGLEGAAETD
eukprot:CAMPEP_0184700110 /NCGR_PEP_ID=MMETSP0313-20130426/8720_1 /TAXON_ID=2792 /ORGANISM="Porphyridium aerugineum, Strain SAG 1380-2" /LENGTH=58 /DNA_ID=CAMNT_0027159523 /DNA_START=163 /DNA_END=339 /DNA_ORIENTATION=-